MGWTGRTLIGGVAAMLAAALLVVLLVRPSGSHRHRAAPARTAAPSPQRHVVRKAPPRRPPARPRKVRPKPAPPVRRVRLPLASARVKPWRRDGTSFVASGRHDWLAVYARPHVQRPSLILRNPDRIGSPRALLVHSKRRHWVRVFLPRRPNGITGWIQRKAVRVLRNPYRIEIRLRAHRLRLWKGKRIVVRAKTVVGKPSTPTPVGMFFITDLLRQPDPGGAYGPYAYNLSAHSRVFFHFAGGDGVVAIHGTNEPWLLGQSASHGCVRVRNTIIRRLARILPLGTPVLIRR